MKWCNTVLDEVSPVRMQACMTRHRRAWYFYVVAIASGPCGA